MQVHSDVGGAGGAPSPSSRRLAERRFSEVEGEAARFGRFGDLAAGGGGITAASVTLTW